ncbi:asparagine synthase-related protein [Sphingopyxis fribergensis]|nr:asparagine synthase-related protein [Sphingopyxis fribergensis]
MSGICGIVPATGDHSHGVAMLESALDAMAHRCRDGMSCFHDEHVLVGHGLLDTGCNGFALDDDGYVVAFDGRLDNGDQLRASLRDAGGLHAPPFDHLSDTRLLLAAYRTLGDALAEHLLGDFSIAIWDPVKQQLYLARDQIGVKPLFYRIVDDALLFASEIKGLLAMRPDLPTERREAAMAAFVQGEFPDADRDRTFFADIYRLLPGHYAIATRGTFTTHCYWRLDADAPVPRDDVGGEFRKLFLEAIRRRLRGNSAVGSLLSGGLDSSSIVSAMASSRADTDPPVQAFSLIFSDPDVEDERDFIAAVVDQYAIGHATVDCSGVSGLAHADAILGEQDQPPAGPNGGIFRYFLKQIAADFSGRVILHGHGGDEVISHGGGLFGELAASGQWRKLWRELQAVRHVTGAPWPHFRRLVWRRGIRRSVGKMLDYPASFLMRGAAVQRDPLTTAPDGRDRPIEQAAHLKKLSSPIFAHALEVIDIEAACAGVELRMPFLDLDVVRFCITVEAQEKWQDGRPRSVLRNAMDGVLPEKVRLRTDKHDFATHLRQSLLRFDRDVIDEAILKRPDLILPYCNLAELRADWSDLRMTGELDGLALMRLWRAVMLSRWLAMENPPEDAPYLEEAA